MVEHGEMSVGLAETHVELQHARQKQQQYIQVLSVEPALWQVPFGQ